MNMSHKHRNKKNKDRGRYMEQRIAKQIKGVRVPMSGAGAMKGDVEGLSPAGLYLIECKLSAGAHKTTGEKHIRFEFEWIEKIRREAKTTWRQFGIVIFRYHDTMRSDYVVVERKDLTRFFPTVNVLPTFQDVDAEQKGFLLYKKHLDMMLDASYTESKTPTRSVCIIHGDNQYIVMRLTDFKPFLETDNDAEEERDTETEVRGPQAHLRTSPKQDDSSASDTNEVV